MDKLKKQLPAQIKLAEKYSQLSWINCQDSVNNDPAWERSVYTHEAAACSPMLSTVSTLRLSDDDGERPNVLSTVTAPTVTHIIHLRVCKSHST